jgi:hypothetical protein
VAAFIRASDFVHHLTHVGAYGHELNSSIFKHKPPQGILLFYDDCKSKMHCFTCILVQHLAQKTFVYIIYFPQVLAKWLLAEVHGLTMGKMVRACIVVLLQGHKIFLQRHHGPELGKESPFVAGEPLWQWTLSRNKSMTW